MCLYDCYYKKIISHLKFSVLGIMTSKTIGLGAICNEKEEDSVKAKLNHPQVFSTMQVCV